MDEVAVPGEGPRIVIATSGSVTLHVSEEQGGDSVELSRGQAGLELLTAHNLFNIDFHKVLGLQA